MSEADQQRPPSRSLGPAMRIGEVTGHIELEMEEPALDLLGSGQFFYQNIQKIGRC